ncbi:MBL fold metallo-hydrolase [Effusibacillus consociatus]|uniref:MBL fold metallo-hydrolase n=1 Tax=Effusibacillus consociatus TaxID=1117041 RepID=A0ABV9Q2H6_9BACL
MQKMIQLERPCKGVVSLAIPTPFQIGDVNVYLLEGKKLTLVDTGANTEESWGLLTQGIEAAGYRLSDLQQVVLTHFHEDHTGLAYRLKKETGATVLAHPDTAVWLKEEPWFIERRNRFFLELYKRAGVNEAYIQKIIGVYQYLRRFGHPCEVDVVLADGETLPSHPEWKVVYTPGHSQTHFSLYRDSDEVMLLADHLIAHVSSNALLEPTVQSEEGRVKSLIQYRQELQKLKQFPISVGLAGHGEPIHDHVDLIDRRFDSMERRAENILEVLKGKQKTAFEVAMQLFPNRQDQLPLILSETIGHLDWLEAEGRLARGVRDGIDRYSV